MKVLGIDLGSYEIKGIVFDLNKKKVINFSKEKTQGYKKGLIVKKSEFKTCLEKIIDEFERSFEKRFYKAVICFNSDNFSFKNQKDFIFLPKEIVRQEDIEKILNYEKRSNLPSLRELVEFVPLTFYLDQVEIEDPLGKEGTRLDLESLVVDCSRTIVNGLKEILEEYFESFKLKFSSLASALFYLNEKEKDVGTLFFDFGHETTSLILIAGGKFVDAKILPVGSYSLTKDLASNLKINIDQAEEIKRQFGSVGLKKNWRKEKIQIYENEYSLKEIVNILEERFEEILEELIKFLKETNFYRNLPGGILLAGGGSKLSNIAAFTKEKTKIYTRRLNVKDFFENLTQAEDMIEYANSIAIVNLEKSYVEDESFWHKIKSIFSF